ncbi:MAG: ribosome silencing factor [Halobacteriovoraceae bacterium]|nr:ribosome silencing factor [Halobacteriovoraceae bacterium]
MSDNFIEKEIKKIFSEPRDEILNMALASSWIMAHFKATNLKIFNAKNLSPLADYFVIGSFQNTILTQSVASALQRNLKGKARIKSVEGMEEGHWVLLDLGDIIIHLFQEDSRDIFDLDSLWKNFPQEVIPNEYYYTSHDTEEQANQNLNKYY